MNDAPLASLSSSNSVNDIVCGKKVMGQTMTQELRKIAQFFMKKFPLDIDSIYYKMPDANLEYFTIKSTAIIGGLCTSVSDMLSKVVLLNSFVRQFEKVILVGEIGLLALNSIGVYPGLVERSENCISEYDSLVEFMRKVFDKSIHYGCEIVLPTDFVTAKK